MRVRDLDARSVPLPVGVSMEEGERRERERERERERCRHRQLAGVVVVGELPRPTVVPRASSREGEAAALRCRRGGWRDG